MNRLQKLGVIALAVLPIAPACSNEAQEAAPKIPATTAAGPKLANIPIDFSIRCGERDFAGRNDPESFTNELLFLDNDYENQLTITHKRLPKKIETGPESTPEFEAAMTASLTSITETTIPLGASGTALIAYEGDVEFLVSLTPDGTFEAALVRRTETGWNVSTAVMGQTGVPAATDPPFANAGLFGIDVEDAFSSTLGPGLDEWDSLEDPRGFSATDEVLSLDKTLGSNDEGVGVQTFDSTNDTACSLGFGRQSETRNS